MKKIFIGGSFVLFMTLGVSALAETFSLPNQKIKSLRFEHPYLVIIGVSQNQALTNSRCGLIQMQLWNPDYANPDQYKNWSVMYSWFEVMLGQLSQAAESALSVTFSGDVIYGGPFPVCDVKRVTKNYP